MNFSFMHSMISLSSTITEYNPAVLNLGIYFKGPVNLDGKQKLQLYSL